VLLEPVTPAGTRGIILAMAAQPVLTNRDLNRALLARQHLLERAAMPATGMIEHLVGMQASMSQAIRFLLALLQPTPRGLWSRTGQATWTTVHAWLGEPLTDPEPVDWLVLRYLGAFGPATVADARTWSWFTGLRDVFERLRPRLMTFRDEAGRELFDLPGAPRPYPDTPAAARFLPEYDNLMLSHDDRSRVIPPPVAARLTGFVGTFLVDGFVHGQWRADRGRGGATLVLDPFLPLGEREREGPRRGGRAPPRLRRVVGGPRRRVRHRSRAPGR